jgi:prepilin-type N-terminal cleavage/methylation domain-containing protein/prepilin-type processing-associated H-X9-DG protein
MRPGSRPRVPPAGLTLVELLVVFAIIGILVALLAPATVRVLARGRLTQCTNNQYQVAFALLRFDDKKRTIPGWLDNNPAGQAGACTWTVPLLPFLGRNDIYDMWPQLPNDPRIDLFVCPSARTRTDPGYPVLHYAGNIGAGNLANTETARSKDKNDGLFLKLYRQNAQDTNFCDPISLDDVADADGAAVTLAFAEKAMVSEKASGGFLPHTWVYSLTSLPAGGPFGSGPNLPPVFGVTGTPVSPVIGQVATRAFAPASNHDGGVVVAFCDGHTGFLADSLQPYEYAQLLTPKSRWQGGVNKTNSTAIQPWLLKSGQPYLLDERILRP